MVKLLIDNGVDVYLVDFFGDLVINWVFYYGYVFLVDLLVQKGVSWDVKSEYGFVIEVVMKQWNDEFLFYFIDKGVGDLFDGEDKVLVIVIC